MDKRTNPLGSALPWLHARRGQLARAPAGQPQSTQGARHAEAGRATWLPATGSLDRWIAGSVWQGEPGWFDGSAGREGGSGEVRIGLHCWLRALALFVTATRFCSVDRLWPVCSLLLTLLCVMRFVDVLRG
jgi:hypothetical protein